MSNVMATTNTAPATVAAADQPAAVSTTDRDTKKTVAHVQCMLPARRARACVVTGGHELRRVVDRVGLAKHMTHNHRRERSGR
jgi:hypothetical protein